MTDSADVTLKPEELRPGVTQAIKYVCCQFLDDKHFTMLHQELSMQWHSLSSLSAAVKLMEQYGVVLTQEDIDRMSQLNEAQQIESLVSKMPQQSNEQFQHFFLQLQILVSTASRVRKALEEGNDTEVYQALSEAESTGISQYILRMAIVQAGTEVKTLKTQYETWMKDADVKMGKLIRGQEDAMQAQKKLANAQGTLSAFLATQNEKVKKILVSFMGGSGAALTAMTFKEWRKVVTDQKMENEIRSEFNARLENVQAKLLEFKASQSAGISKMMQKRGAGKDSDLVEEVFGDWKKDYENEKAERANAEKAAELEAKMKDMKSSQVANSKKVLARMNGANDQGLKEMAIGAWKEVMADKKKLAEQEREQNEAAEKMAKFMNEKKDGARKVLGALTSGQDGACMKMTFDAWKEVWDDAKREAAIAEALAGAEMKMGGFNSRNKAGAMSATERAAYNLELMLLMRAFGMWKLDTKMEGTLRSHSGKIDSKRQQLVMVQQMFRNFAVQLESGLKEDNSGRFEGSGSKKKMNKNEGSCSLPDINQK